MSVESFILYGEIHLIRIGSNIKDLNLDFEIIKEGENDIPFLYKLIINKEYFEITTIKDVIIGISCVFNYDYKEKYKIVINDKSFFIGYESSLIEVKRFFELSNLNFKIIDDDEIVVLKSKVSLIFSLTGSENLHKAILFDKDLYNKLTR